ncbi:MAG: Hsp20/alpha crystallin family protein [Planctomycetes bacterium]|nr:Hsp20/alpha crystallin family protein [Planctomycetota bacterium]
MNITPWRERRGPNTFRDELETLFDRFPFGEMTSHLPAVFRGRSTPAVDVSETEKAWTYAFEMPGLQEKDIQVSLMGRQLVVTAERKWEEESKGKEFRRVESQFGKFERSIQLPDNVRAEADSITASYKRGVLEVVVPKVEPTPSTKIPVKGS